MTTHGKYRHLTRCSTDNGHFLILAVDHRGNLRADLDRHAAQPLSDAEFAAFKGQIAAAAGMASAVLTDPDLVWAAALPTAQSVGDRDCWRR